MYCAWLFLRCTSASRPRGIPLASLSYVVRRSGSVTNVIIFSKINDDTKYPSFPLSTPVDYLSGPPSLEHLENRILLYLVYLRAWRNFFSRVPSASLRLELGLLVSPLFCPPVFEIFWQSILGWPRSWMHLYLFLKELQQDNRCFHHVSWGRSASPDHGAESRLHELVDNQTRWWRRDRSVAVVAKGFEVGGLRVWKSFQLSSSTWKPAMFRERRPLSGWELVPN